DTLSDMGLVNRAHGGAVARPMGVQPPVSEREQSTVNERRHIAAKAATLVSAGEVLMIDAGSTTTQLAWRLCTTGEALTTITNSYPVAAALQGSKARIIVCPGEFNGHEGGVYGQDTSEFLKRFHANTTFIGASGLAAGGVTDVNRGAAWVKRTMIERCEHIYLLVDHTKFDLHVLEVVAPLDALSGVVTDRAPPGPLAHALREAGVALYIASGAEAPDFVLPHLQEEK
ncbi:MAG: DeoR/GlpR family DNA-binding transcription regulator, partial [Salinisphaera sp.]|nr:DeoR/GlpR family DNA-binding transcription regulator [Salinisphaera sp.]